MITGSSRFVYRINAKITSSRQGIETFDLNNLYISYGVYQQILNEDFLMNSLASYIAKKGLQIGEFGVQPSYEEISKIHVDVNIVDGIELDIEAFKKWRNGEYANAEFILENGEILLKGENSTEVNSKYICGVETEKMSKSKFNTVNPDDLVEKFGADTFRMYEMFLGPVEASKPWDTKGIEGVHRFLKKLWRLFYDEMKGRVWKDEKATAEELKILHRAIRKIEDDTERFSFNTAVSTFMICVNELNDSKCHKKEILEQVLILLTPYAPHIAEELWHQLGNAGSILDASYPVFDAKYIIESSKEYPVSINGRVRTNINIALDAAQPEVEQLVLANETVQKWLEGKPPKRIIYVKNKMVNVVV
jgi:leucyl-tRNA synthetase